MKEIISKSPLIIFLLILTAFDVKAQVKVKYDRFDDDTTVRLRIPLKKYGDETYLELSLFGYYKGRTIVKKPANVDVQFIILNRDAFNQPVNLVWLIDGVRLRLGVIDENPYWFDLSKRRSAFWLAPFEVLSRIANATTVEGKIEYTEFALDSGQIKLLREFLWALTP